MSKLKIGWAEESLVPPKKVNLAGQFIDRISQYVEDEISATAMAVEAEGEQMILVSCDVVKVSLAAMATIREKLSAICPDFPAEKLMVAATHSHTSLTLADPKPYGPYGSASTGAILQEYMPGVKVKKENLVDDTVMTPMENFEFFTDKVALAAKNAWQAREDALMANEFGRAAVGMCRRVSYSDGTAEMWGDTNKADFVSLEGGNDSGIELIYTFNTKKELTGVAANITCPAQVLEHRTFISGDYWSKAKKSLEEKLGRKVFLLGLCGAAGDQCPRDLVRWVEPETPINDPNVSRPNVIPHKADPSMYDLTGCKRVGKRIAAEIVNVLEEITDYQDSPVFIHKVMPLSLPLRKATKAEHDQACREIQIFADRNRGKEYLDYVDIAKMYVYAGTISRYRFQQTTETYPMELHVVRLGSIAMVTNPFELFLDYGNRIKARSLAQQTFIVQLACGGGAYLPTEKAEKAGHYSAYISSGFVGHEGGDLLTRVSIDEINNMFR